METYVGHKKIKEFTIDGQLADDKFLPEARIKYENILVRNMKSRGYLPIFDIDTAFSIKYEDQHYIFKLTAYGVFVGKVRSKCYSGVVSHNLIP